MKKMKLKELVKTVLLMDFGILLGFGIFYVVDLLFTIIFNK